MEHISVTFNDGFKNTIIKTGHGPALIILHGWTSYIEDWIYYVEAFKSQYTCYIWNARCFYQEKTTMAQLARDIEFLIDYFSIETPHLLGHSMGAMTIFELIRKTGCLPYKSLTIIDQSPKIITDTSWRLGLFKNFTQNDNNNFMATLHTDFVKAAIYLILTSKIMTQSEQNSFMETNFYNERIKYLQTLSPQTWTDIWSDFSLKDYRNVIPTIDLPTLLIYGEKSNFYGPEVGHYMHAALSSSTLLLYPDSGHSPQMEQAERFITDINDFLLNL